MVSVRYWILGAFLLPLLLLSTWQQPSWHMLQLHNSAATLMPYFLFAAAATWFQSYSIRIILKRMLHLIPFAFLELDERGGWEKPAACPRIAVGTLILMNQSQAGPTRPRAAMCHVAFQSNHHEAFYTSSPGRARAHLPPCALYSAHHLPPLWEKCLEENDIKPCAQRIRNTQHTADCSQTCINGASLLLWWAAVMESSDRRATVLPGGRMNMVCMYSCVCFYYVNSNGMKRKVFTLHKNMIYALWQTRICILTEKNICNLEMLNLSFAFVT